MKKKTKKRLPNFDKMTYEEEANWWDTHSITDYKEEMEDVEIIFDLQKPKEETLILRLQKDVKKKLEKTAKRKGINVSTLARIWLAERLQSTRP